MDKPLSWAACTFLDQPNAIRRPASAVPSAYEPVLAAFDPYRAVVWTNERLAQLATRNRPAGRQLCDEDTETLAHEFARALQFRDIFQEFGSRADRAAALSRRRARLVMRSTSESYANRRLAEERRAEETVQRIRMEILSSFDREQRGSGLKISDMGTRAEESAADMIRNLRPDYLASAKREFARLHQSARPDAAESNGSGMSQVMPGDVLAIGKIRWLFPTRLSPTLTDLIDEMIALQIDIVIARGSGD